MNKVFRLKVGFQSWEDMEWRVRTGFKGTFIGENGDVLEGEFKSLQLHGKGSKKLSNGRIENGEFKNDRLNGQGKLEWNGLICEGLFEDGRLTENFKATLSTGASIPETDELDLDFKKWRLRVEDDVISEMETLNLNPSDITPHQWIKSHFNNSNMFEGEFKNGIRHGFGVIYENKNIKKVGLFENGVMMKGVDVFENGYLQKFTKTLLEVELETLDFGKNIYKKRRKSNQNKRY